MSTPINDGGPAFPCPVGHIECAHPEGMSLRAWLAGQALANTKVCSCTDDVEINAEFAVRQADAVLRRLSKP